MLTGQPGGSKASLRSEPLSTWTSREVGNVFGVVQVKGGEASMLEPRFGVREEKKNKRGVGGFLDKAKAEQFLKLPSRASLWAHPSLPKECAKASQLRGAGTAPAPAFRVHPHACVSPPAALLAAPQPHSSPGGGLQIQAEWSAGTDSRCTTRRTHTPEDSGHLVGKV